MSRQAFKRTHGYHVCMLLLGVFGLMGLFMKEALACEVVLPSGEPFQLEGKSCPRPRKVLWQSQVSPKGTPQVCQACCLVRYPGYHHGVSPWVLLWNPAQKTCAWAATNTLRVVTATPLWQRLYRAHLQSTWDVTQYMTHSGNNQLPRQETPEEVLESLFGP
ncbi:MAG: hypothetical protein ACKO37_07155 [Vampirovibrionales bacterium]